MTRRKDPIDQRFENLLREQMYPAAPDAMAGLVRELRHAYVTPFSMDVQNRQIGDLVVAGREAGASRPSPLRRRVNGVWYRFSQRFIAGSVVGKVILAASVATAATTGMAATGHLPDSVQIAVSAAAAQIGLSIPTPSSTPSQASGTPEPPAPKRPAAFQAPAAGPSQAPPPATGANPQRRPAPASQPAAACDPAALSASPAPPPPSGTEEDMLKALQHMTEEQVRLDELLRCLAPSPTPPPPAPSSGEGGSADLDDLLRNLLGG